MMIDANNPVIELCIRGTQAEFRGEIDQAHGLYQQAWNLAGDPYEACIAAHYLARYQPTAEERFDWNRIALEQAQAADAEAVRPFLPSLYLTMGHAYERLGGQTEAQRYYDLAAALGVAHQGVAERGVQSSTEGRAK